MTGNISARKSPTEPGAHSPVTTGLDPVVHAKAQRKIPLGQRTLLREHGFPAPAGANENVAE
jgi:hypothetical protein